MGHLPVIIIIIIIIIIILLFIIIIIIKECIMSVTMNIQHVQ